MLEVVSKGGKRLVEWLGYGKEVMWVIEFRKIDSIEGICIYYIFYCGNNIFGKVI